MKFLLKIFTIAIFLSSFSIAVNCANKVKEEFKNLIKRDLNSTKLKELYSRCNDLLIKTYMDISIADDYESKNQTEYAYNYYKKAYYALKDSSYQNKKPIKEYLQQQIKRYKTKTAEDILREATVTRGNRGAGMGDIYTLKNIPLNFSFDSSDIREGVNLDQANEIGKAIKKIGKNIILIELKGYTDTKGKASYNLNLSKRRANALKEFLVKNYNISSSFKITQKGESSPICKKDMPVIKNGDEYSCKGGYKNEDAYKSRRVTVTIIKVSN